MNGRRGPAPEAAATPGVNTLSITGTLVEPPQQRTTPAGIPITRFVLQHRSEQREAGQRRQVECRLRVVAAGSPLAERCAGLHQGEAVQVHGFLARAGYRAPELKTELHALAVEPVPNER